MTVSIVYRIPKVGAVFGCDSRITNDGSDIISDYAEKWAVCGSVTAVFAGTIGGLWDDIRETPTKNWKDFRARITNTSAEEQGLDYDILAYDRKKDMLLHTGHHGDGVVVRSFAGIGSGAAYAIGYLDAGPVPNSLPAAAKLVEAAVRVAIKRNSSCGGRIRVLTVAAKSRSAPIVR